MSRKWTKETAFREAKKYNSRTQLWIKQSGLGNYLVANGWMDEACAHIPTIDRDAKSDAFTFEQCKAAADQCTSTNEFYSRFPKEYNASVTKGWIDELAKDMIRLVHVSKGTYTREYCKSIASNYATCKELCIEHRGVYDAIRRHKEWDDAEFTRLKKTQECKRNNTYNIIWTLDKAIAVAKTCFNRTEWNHTQANKWCRKHGYIEYVNTFVPHHGGEQWTIQKASALLSTYKFRGAFKKDHYGAWKFLKKQGAWDDLTAHMEYVCLPKNYWTKERVFAEGVKYESIKDFTHSSGSAYAVACQNNWIDEIREHMTVHYKYRNGYWTYERCIEIASKCKTRYEFRNSPAWFPAQKNGWLHQISKLLDRSGGIKDSGYWTYDKCEECALQCRCRSELCNEFPSAYGALQRMGRLDEACSHMLQLIVHADRCIYAAEFADGYAYVGLTNNFERRTSDHMTDENSPVFKHYEETWLVPEFKFIADYMEESKAQQTEGEMIELYKNLGWNMLNSAKAGAVGACKHTPSHLQYHEIDSISIPPTSM